MSTDGDHVESHSASSIHPPMPAVIPQVIPHNFPLPSAMNCRGDVAGNWEFFRQQWSDYEIATGLIHREETIRLATLRSAMGRDCLQIFLNLNLSDDDKKKIDRCLEALDNYFKPSRNVVYERYVFNTCVQTNDESVQSYVTRLRKLATSCEYGELTDDLIRDRLVIGLKHNGDKVRLLREKNLDLKKAIQMCTTSEVAAQQMKKIQSAEDNTEDVKKFDDKKKAHRRRRFKNAPEQPQKSNDKQTKSGAEPRAGFTCKYCGRQQRHVKRTECPAFGKTCSNCGKKGHFSSVCLITKKVNQFEDLETSSEDEACLNLETVSLVDTKARQWFTEIQFFKSPKDDFTTSLSCQLDTGATCNVLCLDDLSAITQLGDPPIQKSSVKLRLFGGSTMKPIGECDLQVKYHDTKQILKFQVVQDKCRPLLSAETCEKLQLIKFNSRLTNTVHQVCDEKPLTEEDLFSKYHDVFTGLGHIGNVKIVVDKNVTPVQHSPRRVPVALRKDVKKKIIELQEKGIIKKAEEPSEWISNMVVVAKPNKIRICLDPKDLNKAVQRPKFQMPTLEELLPELSKARIFSSFDAKDGFYQVSLDEESSKLTTFWTPLGRYRYLRMPFGISLAPEVFESTLQECLADLRGVKVIRDDILVVGYGATDAEAQSDHDRNVTRLLERARQVNLKLNKSKVKLRKTEVKFMGHVISNEGLKPDPDKVSAIKNMPKPTSNSEVQTLLGFVNYLSKFLPKLSDVSAPLRELTISRAKFTWARQHDEAFATIQQLVIQHPVLKFYNEEEEATIQTDASDKGLGAVLLQNGQPVAFASRTLSKTEQRYATIEKECLAIVFGCERFNQYLARREKIHIETDHKPLESIFRKSLLAAPCRLQRMLLRLQRYNLAVKYKPGSQMVLADHLSRAAQYETTVPKDSFQVFSVELERTNPMQALKISPERLEQLQRCTGQDESLQTLKTTILSGWPAQRDHAPVNIREYWNFRDELSVHNGILFKSSKVIIPRILRPEVMSKIHSSHLGIEACLRKARDSVFWPNMSGDVRDQVSQCSICAELQSKNPKEPMQSHQIPDRPWSRVAADQFKLHGKDYIVIVDFYSDFIEVKMLEENTSSAVIEFLKEQFSRHGLPDILVTDNGPQFTSQEFMQFTHSWEFVHVSSSPHHHKSNGKVEAAVKVAKSLFKKALKDNRDPWLALLDQRNTPTESLGSSPVQRLMSRRTRTLLPTATNLLYPKVPENVDQLLRLKRQKAKFYHDRSSRVLPEIEIGQDVRVAPLQKNDVWKSGTCVEKLSDRSYVVQTDADNHFVRRNRAFLKPAEKPAPPTPSSKPVVVSESQPSDHSSSPATVPDHKTISPTVKRTRTRIIKPPARLSDYTT